MLVITLAAVTVPTASRITVVCLPAVNVNGISAADLIVEALGQLSVEAVDAITGAVFVSGVRVSTSSATGYRPGRDLGERHGESAFSPTANKVKEECSS